MQLRRAGLLALGVAGLVGDARAQGVRARASTEMAGYSDSDHVAVLTPTVTGHVDHPSSGWSIDATYLVDVVSAASVDIVSTASRRWTEVRQAGSSRAAYKPHDLGAALEGSVSSEPDYLAYATGATVERDFAGDQVTLKAGYGYGHDTVGRAGTPFRVYSHAFDHHSFDGGITVLVDPRTVVVLATDVTIQNGDSSKPYRYVPMFSAGLAPSVPAGATVQWVSRMRLPIDVTERLPLTRDRYGLTARLARRLRHSTFRLEGQLYDDSWGLAALGLDWRHLFDAGSGWSLGPHARYYVQSAVSFWKVGYVGSPVAVPALRTGDRELGPLMNVTFGGRARWTFAGDGEGAPWSLVGTCDATYTRFLDDLYITRRLSQLTSLGVEGAW
jgi:hypothetical protein